MKAVFPVIKCLQSRADGMLKRHYWPVNTCLFSHKVLRDYRGGDGGSESGAGEDGGSSKGEGEGGSGGGGGVGGGDGVGGGGEQKVRQ